MNLSEYDFERMSLDANLPYDQDDEPSNPDLKVVCDFHNWMEFRCCMDCGTLEKLERL